MARRPDIPRPLRRQVLVEAGHRCAIPTCRTTTVDVHHIEPWSESGEHVFEDLLALCPTCHRRVENGEIDRLSVKAYKQNLGLLSSRYGDHERRLLDWFIRNPGEEVFHLRRDGSFDFMFLLADGLVEHVPPAGQIWPRGGGDLIQYYRLTPAGLDLVDRQRQGTAIEE